MDWAEKVGSILLRDLEGALKDFDACVKDFGRVAKEIDSGLQHPDGNLALRLAGDRRRRAFNVLQRATARHTAFTMHGVIPEDLRPDDTPRPQLPGSSTLLCSEERRLWDEYLVTVDEYGYALNACAGISNAKATAESAARLRLARRRWESHCHEHHCSSRG
jgi:hypothetical protein